MAIVLSLAATAVLLALPTAAARRWPRHGVKVSAHPYPGPRHRGRSCQSGSAVVLGRMSMPARVPRTVTTGDNNPITLLALPSETAGVDVGVLGPLMVARDGERGRTQRDGNEAGGDPRRPSGLWRHR